MDAPEGKTIRFHYIKSPGFSTIHVDGAIGGVTPSGLLHVALYSERMAIPQETVYVLNEDNSLGDEIKSEVVTRGGVVREMQVDAVMTSEAAQRLFTWFGRQLTVAGVDVQALMGAQKSEDESDE